MSTKSNPPHCVLITTHYQACNHLTTSLHHAEVRLQVTPASPITSTFTPKTITTCPQAIHNLSLFPAPTGKALIDTTRCVEVQKRTVINGGYRCPDCEPEYHLTGEDVVDEVRWEEDTDSRGMEKEWRERRVKWCWKAIEEWEKDRDNGRMDSG